MGKPLEGIRVLELDNVLAGPSACMLLADMGADVIKVETPEVGDMARDFGPFFRGGESVYFMCMNRNKRSITLDLKTPKGKEIFHGLVKKSDVILEAFRPGVTQRLNIDYETVKKINPGLVYCSLTGFGQEGPNKHKPSFDQTVEALSGMMSTMGEPDRPPTVCGIPIADICTGHLAILGITSALVSRERTGVGRYIDVSMMDVMVFMLLYQAQFYLSDGLLPRPAGSGHPTNIPVRGVKTKDEKYLEIYASPQKFYEKLAQVIALHVKGMEELPSDPRFADSTKRFENKAALFAIMDKAFATKTINEWLQILEKADVPCAPVCQLDETFKNPQVSLRNMVVEINHPKDNHFKTIGDPIKFSDMKEEFRPSPLLGQHSAEILSEILGYSAAQVEELRKTHVI